MQSNVDIKLAFPSRTRVISAWEVSEAIRLSPWRDQPAHAWVDTVLSLMSAGF